MMKLKEWDKMTIEEQDEHRQEIQNEIDALLEKLNTRQQWFKIHVNKMNDTKNDLITSNSENNKSLVILLQTLLNKLTDVDEKTKVIDNFTG